MIVNPIIPIVIMGILCVIIISIKTRDKNAFIRKMIISILLFLINLRIMMPSKNVTMISNNLDVLFVIDSTISMAAEDGSANKRRIEDVKEDCEYIVNELVGARFAVITFDNNSKILAPFTKDSNMVIESIKAIQVMDKLYAKGSSLNTAQNDIIENLKKSYEKKDRSRIIFFISDGEITNDEKLKSFSELKKYVDNGAVLGYGTEKGAYMSVKDWYSEKEEYIMDDTDYKYEKAISKMDKSNLRQIANDIGIDFIHMNKQQNIKDKIKEIKQDIINAEGEEKESSYEDIYYIFVAPLIILLMYEFISYKRRI